MTVSAPYFELHFLGDGAEKNFTYSWEITRSTDLAVWVDGEIKTHGTHYTVTGVGQETGGEVRFITAPADGAIITIIRAMPLTRQADLQEGAGYRVAIQNREFDQPFLGLQQVDAKADRAIRIAPYAFDGAAMEITEDATERAGKLVTFNGDGDIELREPPGFEIGATAEDLNLIGNTTFETLSGGTLTGASISGSTNTITNIGNSSLTNSAITLGSTSVSLGGTATSLTGLTLSGATLSGATTLPNGGSIGSGGLAHFVGANNQKAIRIQNTGSTDELFMGVAASNSEAFIRTQSGTPIAFAIDGGSNKLLSLISSGVSIGGGLNFWQFSGNGSANNPYAQATGTDTNIGFNLLTKGSGTHNFYTNSGSLQFSVLHTASAVNYPAITGGAAGNASRITSNGSDSNIGFSIYSKGTGAVTFYNGVYPGFSINSSATAAVNYLAVQGGATGVGVYLSATGSDTNIEAYYSSKGSGTHRFFTGGVTASEQFKIAHVASADTYLVAAGFQGSGGSGPRLFADSGTYSNCDIVLGSKGGGSVDFGTSVSTSGFTRQFRITHTAGAVNYWQFSGNGSANNPYVQANGNDANIGLNFLTKGTGTLNFYTNSGWQVFRMTHTASAVNFMDATGGASGSYPVLSAQGADSNIDLGLTPKGTGLVRFGTFTSGGDAALTGYIEIKDAAGNIRKIPTIA